jgi:hypothetical protein
MSIWFMRDNHTFRKLPTNHEEAKEILSEEFDAGYKHGMVGGEEEFEAIQSIHMSGNWARFLVDLRRFYDDILSLTSNGANI